MARQFSAPRRERLWSALPEVNATLTVAGTTGGSQLAFSSSQTVVRMIGGGFLMYSDSAPTGADAMSLTVAIGVVSTDAATLGATALPDPAAEPDYPWLYWKPLAIFAAATTVVSSDGPGFQRYSFDIRAQRKLKAGQSLALFAEYVDGNGTPPVRWHADQTRVLLLES